MGGRLLVIVGAAPSAEIPARADGGVMAVEAARTEVGRSQRAVVAAQPKDAVTNNPDLEVIGHFDPRAERAIEGYGIGRRRIADLRTLLPRESTGWAKRNRRRNGVRPKGCTSR